MVIPAKSPASSRRRTVIADPAGVSHISANAMNIAYITNRLWLSDDVRKNNGVPSQSSSVIHVAVRGSTRRRTSTA